MHSFIEEFKLYKHNYTQELRKRRMKKEHLEDTDKIKKQQRNWAQDSRKRRREENSDQIKAQQRHHAENSRKKRRDENNEKVKDQQQKYSKA